MERRFRRLADDLGAEHVGNDQSGIGRHDLGIEIAGNGEEQAIAVVAVLGPFHVAAEIVQR